MAGTIIMAGIAAGIVTMDGIGDGVIITAIGDCSRADTGTVFRSCRRDRVLGLHRMAA
jgi:hypothetical protein